MSDLKLATSAIPSVLYSSTIPGAETTVYTAPANTCVRITNVTVVNTTGSTVNDVRLSVVKSGGTAGAANRVYHKDMAAESAAPTAGQAGSRDDLRDVAWLSPGDFISVIAGTAAAVSLVISGIAFSSPAGGAAVTTAVVDAVGAGNRTTASSTCVATHVVGTGSNRYLLAVVSVSNSGGGWMDWTAFTTATVVSNVGGAFTRLASANVGVSGQRQGSVHIFALANPANGSHTITATFSGGTTAAGQIVLDTISFANIASVTGAATAEPTAAGTTNLSVTSAVNNLVVLGWTGDGVPLDANRPIRYFNGGYTAGQADYMAAFVAPGAATVQLTTSNSLLYGAVGVSLVST